MGKISDSISKIMNKINIELKKIPESLFKQYFIDAWINKNKSTNLKLLMENFDVPYEHIEYSDRSCYNEKPLVYIFRDQVYEEDKKDEKKPITIKNELNQIIETVVKIIEDPREHLYT